MLLPTQPSETAELARQATELHLQGRLAEAIECYRQLLRTTPEQPRLHYNLGVALYQLGNHPAAITAYSDALRLRPAYPEAWCNLGIAQKACGALDAAIECYREALRLQPGSADAHSNLGNALYLRGDLRAAASHCRQAIALNPTHAQACNNLGNALKALGNYAVALQSYQRAVELNPDYPEAHANTGHLFQEQGEEVQALACYDKALQLVRDYPEALGNYFYLRLNACDWRDYATLRDTIIKGVASGNTGYSVLPFIAVSDSAQLQLCCAKAHVSHNHPAVPTPLVATSRRQRDKIRIAYLSADLREHAVSYLAAGLFAMHDRHRFEVSAISLAPCPDNEIGRRLRHSFDAFIEVQQLTDREIAVRIRDLGIDILIDLMGFTRSCRPNILAFRPAPIQVNYLGFPATMGATYIDYIIADDYVIPPESRDCYQEKTVSLPDCFQVNDSQRFLPGGSPARTVHGLPEYGFVFCCFNNTNKITPPVFDCWMRLLRAHTDSVFWLVANDERSRANLRSEAEQRGVDPTRLVFADRMPYHAHLQRLQLADLFLDTFPFNAGTTASDALWAGVPLITCSGEAFASRMAGSLLRACGLTQLITHTMADYETLALRLANNPDELHDIRDTLVAQRTTGSLFDTQRFCRHLETAFNTMIETLEQGKPPKSFSVAAET